MIFFKMATNFDSELLENIGKLNKKYNNAKVYEIYGSLPKGVVGSGRHAADLPDVSQETIVEHVAAVHKQGMKFNYLLNAPTNLAQEKTVLDKLRKKLDSLQKAGVDSITITDDSVIKIALEEYSALDVNVSLIKGIDTLEEAQKYSELGVESITLNQHTVNRNPGKIKEIVEGVSCKIYLYANVSCLDHCSIRDQHYKNYVTNAAISTEQQNKENDPFTIKCAISYLKNPVEFLKSPFIRPEDLEYYQRLGIYGFKLSDRNEPTNALTALLEAYMSQEFHGNLFNLLFRDGRKWTKALKSIGIIDEIKVPNIHMDNDKLTKMNFLQKITTLKEKELEKFYEEATEQAVEWDKQSCQEFLELLLNLDRKI